MKVLTTLTVSGGLNMASTAKDVFTIGTPLENNDGNVDDLYVYANTDFKNNVILGSSSVDVVTSNAQITASSGVLIQSSSLFITGSGSTVYINGQDITQGGGGSAVNYYLYTLVTSSTFTIDDNEEYEIVYCDPTPVSGNITITLPNASSDNVANRKFTIKHIGNSDLVIVSASNSQNIEGSSGIQIYGINSAPSASVVTIHAMKDTRDNSFKWYRINYIYG